ncbi:MAG: TonB-dependent receptor plug domain-containing protein, partial [Chitinophagaceae bacterium]
MMKKTKCRSGILFFLSFLLFLSSQAQNRKIIGTVKDNTGSTLSNVSIQVRGSKTGTIIDANGSYLINVSSRDSRLVFSFAGMETQEISVGEQTTVNVQLQTSNNAMGEVVVIGYGTAKRSDVTGAVTSIKGEQLMDKPAPNISQALEGKVAGVDVSINSNAPGAGAKVRVRGIGSINSNIDPLYVVDGVIGVDGNSINPNDIASLEVLKDASSTAIFGSRGANGVIIITTKRGKHGGTSVTYDGNTNVTDLYRHLKTLNADQFVQVYNQSFANGTKYDPVGGVWTPPVALNHTNFPLLFDANDTPLYNTNWESEVYKPS